MHSDDEFSGVISRYRIAMDAVAADANPHMPNASESMDHWSCTLTAEDGDPLEAHVSLDAGYGAKAPTIPLVLSLICEDVRSYRACDGFGTWARRLGLDVFGDAEGEKITRWEDAYEEIARLSTALDRLLGHDTAATLVGEDLRRLPGAEPDPDSLPAPAPRP